LALDAANMGTFVWYVEADRTEPDARMLKLFGLPADGQLSLATALATMIHPADRARFAEGVESSTDPAGPGTLREDVRVLDSGGKERWIAITGQTFFTSDMRRAGRIVGTAADITERKRAEEALREADRRKDEFLAMLAHELRNPLAPIRNAAQLLNLVGIADADQQWACEVIGRQTQHLTRLVDDLLDVSRITSGKVALQRETLELATIIDRAVETSRPLIETRRQQLILELSTEQLRVKGDLTRLVQVISNLLNNAAKYTDEGGHIWLEAARESGEAVLSVRDDGMGLPADLLPYVFDLFTQGNRSIDRSQGGLGIGLTLVRNLVELHGGQVEARSEGKGRGSEFIVRLPLIKVQSLESESERAAPEAQDADRKNVFRVLVVEDNPDLANLMAMIVRRDGHEVQLAHDGLKALEVARAFQPQVVLCDIGLPEMNGYEFAKRLREQPEFQQIRLIALSGYGQEESRRHSIESGFDYHLIKPVEPEELRSLLHSLSPAKCTE
jgi:PAS domain S-box-containing protein